MYAKNLIDGIKTTSSQSTNKVISEKAKGTTISSFIGAGVGIAIAYQRKSNLVMGIFLGALVGGVLSSIFIDKQFSK
jgi:hypothetical protein